MYERERERERKGREGRAINVLLIHSIFVVAFIIFFFFFLLLLYLQYTYSAFVTKLTSSAVTRIEVSSGWRKSLIWKNVLFRKRCCKFSSKKLTLYHAIMFFLYTNIC